MRAVPKKRIPVAKLKEYYQAFGGDPADLRYVTHAYRDDKGRYFARMPLSQDAWKGVGYSTATTIE